MLVSRPLRSEDLDACLEIVRVNHPDDSGKEALARQKMQLALDEAIPPGPRFLILESAGTIFGFGAYLPTGYDADGWGICWVNIAPNAQRQGHGTVLMKALMEAVKQAAQTKPYYILGTCKRALIPFYESFGFKVILDRGKRCLMAQDFV